MKATASLYCSLCHEYAVQPDPSVLVALRARSATLKPSRRLSEADLLPIVDLFDAAAEDAASVLAERQGAPATPDEDVPSPAGSESPPDDDGDIEKQSLVSAGLSLGQLRFRKSTTVGAEGSPETREPTLARVRRLDLSGCRIGSNGAELLACMLEKNSTIRNLNLSNCKIGPRGFRALAGVLATNETLERVALRGNFCFTESALVFASAMSKARHSLKYLDVANSRMTWVGVDAVTQAVASCNKAREYDYDKLVLVSHGNLVKEESLNTITHGIGLVLSIIGAIAMMAVHAHKPADRLLTAAVFSVTMIFVYLSSFLYHLSFQCPSFKRVMHRLDKAAIYCLIAGTYTPFAVLTLRGIVGWVLLGAVWLVGLFGILLDMFAFYRCLNFKTGLCLAMGWMAVLVAVPAITHPSLPITAAGIAWLAAGGVSYTAGVYFFVQDEKKPINHFFWHLFVLLGSLCHWICIMFTVLNMPLPVPEVNKFYYS